MRLAWLTDIHTEFLNASGWKSLLERLRQLPVDAFLLGGDIATADILDNVLRRLDRELDKPIYFVLGNHDYYFGSIYRVREQVREICKECRNLTYLVDREFIRLTENAALMGHDGWADGREGDYEGSSVMLNDYKLIAELAPYNKAERRQVLEELAAESVEHARRVLPQALDAAQHVLYLTHVPPWRAATWHQGRLSDDEWAPHFCNQMLGRALLEIMAAYPTKRLTVLCGHIHSPGFTTPLPNIEVYTGIAEYGNPTISRIIDVAPD